MEKTVIANLSVAEAKALRLLERKRGAGLEVLCTRLAVEERQARSVIDRLRRKGVTVERTSKGVFHAEHVEDPAPEKVRRSSRWDGSERRNSNRRANQLPAR